MESKERYITDKTIFFWITIVIGILLVIYFALSLILGESISYIFTYDIIIFLILIIVNFVLDRIKIDRGKKPRTYKLVCCGKIVTGVLTVVAVSYVIIVNFIL